MRIPGDPDDAPWWVPWLIVFVFVAIVAITGGIAEGRP